MRCHQSYCAPTFELRFAQRRALGIRRRLHRVRARRGRTRTSCLRGTAAPGSATRSSSGRDSSAPRPTPSAPSHRNPGWGTAGGRRRRWARRNRNRPARSCHGRRSATPCISSASAKGSGPHAGSRTSSHSPYRFGSGPVAFVKQGSFTRPRYFQRLSRRVGHHRGATRLSSGSRASRSSAWPGRPTAGRYRLVQTIHMLRP